MAQPDYYDSENDGDAAMDGKGADSGAGQFMVPKEAFGGKEPQPGQEYIFKALKINDDAVVMEYSTAKADKEPEGDEAPAPGMDEAQADPMMD